VKPVRMLLGLAVVLGAAAAAAQPLPPGHPPTDAPPAQPPGGEMPPGHPPMPPDHPPAEENRGVFRPPQDQTLIDDSMAPGTIEVLVADADNQAVADAPIVLGIFESSVDKGDKRSTAKYVTDGDGHLTISGLQYGSGVSYRIVSEREGATFATEAFGLKDKGGVKVLLHVYDSVDRLADAVVLMEAVVLLEIREDDIAVHHRITVANLGRQAWLAKNDAVRLALPQNAKAFSRSNDEDEEEWDIRIVERDGQLALTGTFAPGQTELMYRYNVPLDGDPEQHLKLPLPPRIVRTSVIVGAGPKMSLDVAGFPEARSGTWMRGERVLQTARDAMASSPQEFLADLSPQLLDVRIGGIPVPGPARWIAIMLAGIAVAGGAYAFTRMKSSTAPRTEEIEELREAQAALLGEIGRLEKGRVAGDIGPKTYARVREALVDAIARLDARIALLEPKVARQKPRRGAQPERAPAPRSESRPASKKKSKAARRRAKTKA
jgi:hypothetical protein